MSMNAQVQTERPQRIQALAFNYASQPKEAVERCNLCGGEYLVQISHRDRYGYAAGAFACGRCGLVFLNPRLSAKAYGEFYASVYRPLVSAYHGRPIDAKSIQAEQREYAIERAEFAAPYLQSIQSPRTLLDIGGSTGVVARHFAERFEYEATVLDPSAEELQEAEGHGMATMHGFMETANFAGKRFDLVLLCQTIDHLLDISLTLDKIRECLKEGGFFFVDIVDFRAGYLRNWSVSEATKIDHPYSLTQETVEAYLRRKGFKVLRKGYAADHLHISYICQPAQEDARYVPSAESVENMLREVRAIQNAPRSWGL
jgi:ubiquinone/menaquinone biosynthesis C-methylase UbiE